MASTRDGESILLWAGVVGPPLFVAVFLVLGVIKPRYDATAQFVSEGSIGEMGWVQILNFIVLGALMLAFAPGLWVSFAGQVAGRAGAALMAVFGIGLVLSGVFVTDAPGSRAVATVHGLLHNLAGLAVFGTLMLACFTFAWTLRSQAGGATYSLVTGIAIPVGFVGSALAGRWVGIAQRALIVVGWTWITVLGLGLLRN